MAKSRIASVIVLLKAAFPDALIWPAAVGVQNLVSAAVHGQSQGLVSNIRVVLSKLYEGKKLGGPGSVDSMLVRVYEPIMFRALAAANPAVRKNALQLMLDVLPLVVSGAYCDQACHHHF